jgi:hypothetical protein
MFNISCGDYTLHCTYDRLPNLYADYRDQAVLAEEVDLGDQEGSLCFISVAHGKDWPFLAVAQRYHPAGGFWPGALLVEETHRLFLGASTRLLCYDLAEPRRLWEDYTDCGFWSWARHGSTALMSAELELAAWNLSGEKQWSTYVEPPWGYVVEGEEVVLDVMGTVSRFSLASGPPPR